MTSIAIVRRDGVEVKTEAVDGRSMMEGIRAAGVYELLALCGGSRSCATCHVIVDPEWIEKVGPATGDESDLLDGSSHYCDRSRLSCQIMVSPALSGIRVTVAPEG